MINVQIAFNGQVSITLTSATQEERQLLELAFAGRSVRTIKGVDNGVMLELEKSEGKREAGQP